MEYKGYIRHVEFDDESEIFHGEVISTLDVITFQGKSVSEIKTEFRNSVDVYLDFCKKHGKEPDKPFLFATGGKDMEIEVTSEDVIEIGKKWEMAALSGMTAGERLAGLAPKERKDILAEFTAEEIEDYLKKLKKQKRKMN